MIAVVGTDANEATVDLASSWRRLGLDAVIVPGRELASARLRAGDVVVARLDILPTLDGVEPGLLDLLRLERSGIRVLNRPRALVTAHDKLRTARMLAAARLPHPPTEHVRSAAAPSFDGPYVVKPRYGSWGRDVTLCATRSELLDRLAAISGRRWFRRHGALVQQAVPNRGRDLRVVVAGGRVVGVGERVAAPGEWRTNVSCGGRLRPARVDEGAAELARAAAAAADADLVGVDLMPATDGTLVVLELNGAVEFDDACDLDGRGVARAAAEALGLLSGDRPRALRAAG